MLADYVSSPSPTQIVHAHGTTAFTGAGVADLIVVAALLVLIGVTVIGAWAHIRAGRDA